MFLDHSTFDFPSLPREPQAEMVSRPDVLVVKPRGLGLGEDMIIGGANARQYRVIDLSQLTSRVEIKWSGPDAGFICDGADSLVFQGVEEIILPPCMIQSQGAA
ncbi:hypothetical protein N4R57_10730 [Rhodobacteraceae bacterium D3-12]|nr:hypothetical protein N4R57_10730 [Rhodobacteraceae bacterium D3-12]